MEAHSTPQKPDAFIVDFMGNIHSPSEDVQIVIFSLPCVRLWKKFAILIGIASHLWEFVNFGMSMSKTNLANSPNLVDLSSQVSVGVTDLEANHRRRCGNYWKVCI